MNNLDSLAFNSLFREAYEKCFGYPLKEVLSETESKLFYNRLYDATGLVVGWKSLKNYSFFILDNPQIKTENPSIATLDSLARFVGNAPYSSETERKEKESHFPYWFGYKEKFHRSRQKNIVPPGKNRLTAVFLASAFFLVIIFLVLLRRSSHLESVPFTEDFRDLRMAVLTDRGWFLQSPDPALWNRRTETPGMMSLFTLRGDNWPNAKEKIGIPNLILRKITTDCFEAEVHFTGFFPDQNWQQAGILLLDDTSFTGRAIRLSLAYNDFFGGYTKPKEIIIQAVSFFGKNYGEPEEIAHQPVLYIDSLRQNPELIQNIKNISLKIEKEGKKFRLLFAGGSVSNPAFREVVTHEFDMHPRYIGLFAMKGFVDSVATIPVGFTFFRLKENHCD